MSQRARPRSPAAFERSGGRADLLDVRTASEYSAEQLHLFFQGVELERVLDRQKYSRPVPCAGHPLLHGGHHRVLEPAALVGVIHPAADEIAVLELRHGIGEIAPLPPSVRREGECGKDVRTLLLPPEDAV